MSWTSNRTTQREGFTGTLERTLPYGAFAEVLGGYLSSGTAEERRRVLDACPDLARLVPALTENPRGDPAAPEDRSRLFAAVVRTLDDLADRQPVLLGIEDLHAAGQETLELLHHLSRLTYDRRWLLLATYREEDTRPGSSLHRFLDAVAREDFCRRLDLGRLAYQDCEELVRQLLPGGSVHTTLLAYVYGLSLGNPLFAEQLVRTLEQNEHLILASGHWRRASTDHGIIPSPVQTLIEARVGGMAAATQQILALAATAGMESSFTILSAAAERAWGAARSEVLDALDEALDARILEEQGESYVFRHPLIRETLYTRLSRQRRRHLHAVIAETIHAQRPDDVEALAHHYLQAGDVPGAIRYLGDAGDRAAVAYANQVAERHYRDLLPLLDDQQRSREAAGIREKLADVLATLSRHDEAITLLEEAEHVYQAESDVAAAGRVVGRIARMHGYRARPADGISRIEATLAGLDERMYPATGSSLYSTLAWLIFSTGGRAEALPAAQHAADLAAHSGDTRLRAETLIAYARARFDMADYVPGRQFMDEAIHLAEGHGHLYELATGLVHRGIYALMIGSTLADAQRAFERALTLVERVGDVDGQAFVLGCLGHRCFYLGDWEAARSHMDRGVALARAVGETYHAAYPPMYRARLAGTEGDWEAARSLSREAISIAQLNGNDDVLIASALVLADLELQQGAADQALAQLRDTAFPLREEAWAYVIQGDFTRAAAMAATLLDEAERRASVIGKVATLWVHGMALAGQGRWVEAQSAFEQAIDGARAVPVPYEEARARLEYGCALLARGEMARGRAQIEQAHALATRLGAAGYIRRAAKELRQAGN